MKKSVRVILSLALFFALACSFGIIYADRDEKIIDKNAVGEELKYFGFIEGDGSGLQADKPITREQALVVLSRLMGKEDEAKSFKKEISFKDVKNKFYKPYIAYSVEKNWITGRTKDVFAYGEQITGKEFAAILLRALGYEEYKGEKYSEVPEKAKEIGLLKDYDLPITDKISRGDAFVMIRNELVAQVKDGKNQENLYENLYFKKYEKDRDKIALVHTNDIHGFFIEEKYKGIGAAKLKRYLDLLKDRNKDVFYVDAGDAVQGSNLVSLSKGEAAIKVLNALNLGAMALGNHEFDYGLEQISNLIEKADFPILACNILDKEGKSRYQPYFIKEIKGKKVAFIGFVTPDTRIKSSGLDNEELRIEEPVVAAKKLIKELKGKADIFIGLCHLGGENQEKDFTSVHLAQNVPEFKVLIDGHSYSSYPEGKLVNGVLIVSAGAHTKNIGYVTIDPKDLKKPAQASLFTKKDSRFIKEEEKMLEVLDEIKKENEKIQVEDIGNLPMDLDGERETVRREESKFGNLLTAALLDATKADIAFVNGGGIRAGLNKGMVKKGDVIKAFPFGNMVSVIKIKGRDVRTALEHGLSAYPESSGRFPHVAGLKVSVDFRQEGGKRIGEILVGDEELEDDREYTLASSDFLLAGGDGYEIFKDKQVVSEFTTLDQILIDYLEKNGFEDAKMTNWLTILNK